MAAAKVFRAPNKKVGAHLDNNVVSKCKAVRGPIDGPYVGGGREKYGRSSDCERLGVGDAERRAVFEESLRHCLAHRLVIVALPDGGSQSLETSPSMLTRIRNSNIESPGTDQFLAL